MPTAELSYEEVETIVQEAAELGTLSPEQTRALETFLALVERRVSEVYQADRLVASRMYDRAKIAEFWQREIGWFQSQCDIVGKLYERLHELGLINFDVMSTLITLGEAVEAVKGHYQLHS
jgi:hypothetical protein